MKQTITNILLALLLILYGLSFCGQLLGFLFPMSGAVFALLVAVVLSPFALVSVQRSPGLCCHSCHYKPLSF